MNESDVTVTLNGVTIARIALIAYRQWQGSASRHESFDTWLKRIIGESEIK